MTDPNSPSEPFDVSSFLPYLLNQTAEQTSRAFQKVYRERYGMLRAEWRVLFHLGQYGRMTASEIARLAMIDKVKISRAVRALEQKEFLDRLPDRSDRRAELLQLTPQGQEAFADLRKEAAAYDAHLTEALGFQDMARLKAALRILFDHS